MQRLLDVIVHRVSWHRRAVGAVLAGMAVLILGTALSAPEGPTAPAVLTTTSLPPGHVLTDRDLRMVLLPSEALPDGGATEAADLVGHSTAVGLEAGTILQPGLLAAGHTTEPGRALVPIALRDENIRALLSPGERISLVASGYEDAQIISDDARVAVLRDPPPTSGIGIGGGQPGPMILVDVPSEQAALVAALGQEGGLRIVLGGTETS